MESLSNRARTTSFLFNNGGSVAPGGSFTIPTGYYFQGHFCNVGKTTGTTVATSQIVDDAAAKIIAVIGKTYIASAGLTVSDQMPIMLAAGSYTVSTPTGFNDTASAVMVYGLLFRI